MAERSLERLTTTIEVVLGDRLVVEQGTRRDYFDEGVVVDAFGITERCPRRLANPPDDFSERVDTARRRIGLLVLRRLATETDPARSDRPARHGATAGPSLADAVQVVMGDPDGWPGRLREWIEGLDRAGRAAVAAAVTTWCDGALRLVGRHAEVVWADPSRTPSWNVPGRVVQLRGNVDATLGGVVSGERLLLLSEAVPGPGDRLRAGYLALLRTLGTRHAPVRVTLGSASTGMMQPVLVDEALLDLATDRVAEIVGHRAAPEHAPATPGPWCRHCHLLDVCESGAERMARTP